jgi:hypothetical protein
MSEIVPFGKYKGQPVEALAADRSYLDWLTAQSWFRERYAGIYTLIINNFTEPSETPEHNRLQARFLDPEFCYQAAIRITDYPNPMIVGLRDDIARENKELQHLRERRSQGYYHDIGMYEREVARLQQTLDQYQGIAKIIKAGRRPDNFRLNAQFEVQGWDVCLEGTVHCCIELKPTLGDDYPAVLRQMKINRNIRLNPSYGFNEKYALIVGECTAAGATIEQITAIFAASGFALLKLSEL